MDRQVIRQDLRDPGVGPASTSARHSAGQGTGLLVPQQERLGRLEQRQDAEQRPTGSRLSG
ncbi:MAG TPA: hypothetical protein PLI01_00275 [Nitrospira sp.]|nr:hypothetical protein [Nitrospira sp.]HNA25194.1 hypothetical protein [Nitrospira sp.]